MKHRKPIRQSQEAPVGMPGSPKSTASMLLWLLWASRPQC